MNLKQVKQQQMLLRLFPEFSSARQTRSTVQVCYLLVTKTQQHIQESKSSKTNCFSQRIPSSWIPRHKSKKFPIIWKVSKYKIILKILDHFLGHYRSANKPKETTQIFSFFYGTIADKTSWTETPCAVLFSSDWWGKRKSESLASPLVCLQETMEDFCKLI